MHAKTQAKIFECANETFGAIRTVSRGGRGVRRKGEKESEKEKRGERSYL